MTLLAIGSKPFLRGLLYAIMIVVVKNPNAFHSGYLHNQKKTKSNCLEKAFAIRQNFDLFQYNGG